MNKRSKSTTLLRETLAHTQLQLQDLKERIDKSRPILATIYDKFKLKESLYAKRLETNKKQISEGRTLAKQYKKLYEDNLKAMRESTLMDRFQQSSSNYIIPEKYQKRIQPQKSKSVYEQYRERVERGLQAQSRENKNPEISSLISQNKKLQTEMEVEIEKLKMVRKRSQKSLRKTCSTGRFHKEKAPAVSKKVEKQINELQLKERILQKNREKLQKNDSS